MKQKLSHPSHSRAIGTGIIKGLSLVEDIILLSISAREMADAVLIGNAIGSLPEAETIVSRSLD
jgi:hypothetical protein